MRRGVGCEAIAGFLEGWTTFGVDGRVENPLAV